jgi:hypothetical protein
MAISDAETIKIVRELLDDGVTEYTLRIDGGPRAMMWNTKGKFTIEIMTAGAFDISEARVMILGLNRLIELGNHLDVESETINKTDVERLLDNLTDGEIAMATKAKKVKDKKVAAKAAKKTAAKGGEKAPRESAAAMFTDLIMAGTLTDDKIFEKVQAKFGLSDDKRKYVAWYRNKLTKDGKKPPAAKA